MEIIACLTTCILSSFRVLDFCQENISDSFKNARVTLMLGLSWEDPFVEMAVMGLSDCWTHFCTVISVRHL